MIGKTRLWGIERRSDTPERLIFIYEALTKLNLPPDFSIIDIAGGRGVILNGIAGAFPECHPEILDIVEYKYDWRKFRPNIVIHVIPLQDFIKDKNNKIYDVVMMLNSYRNWKNIDHQIRIDFDRWLTEHAKYFITSGATLPYERGEIRGNDYKMQLQLFKMPLSKK